MTTQERVDIAKVFEKSWYKSKKFIAFITMEILLFAVLITLVFYTTLSDNFALGWPSASLGVSLVFTMGFLALAFNNKQAALDKYVRGVALLGSVSKLKGDDSVPTTSPECND